MPTVILDPKQPALNDFVNAYIEAYDFMTNEKEPIVYDDLTPDEQNEICADCARFYNLIKSIILNPNFKIQTSNGYSTAEMAGHDFYMTRYGYGVGFWESEWQPHCDHLMTLIQPFNLA